MRVKILGSAAGGGFPQWNCACANCRGLREGTLRSRARTQTQIAFSPDPDAKVWFLVSASPGEGPGFVCDTRPAAGSYPDYVGEEIQRNLSPDDAAMGFVFEQKGKSVFIAPSLSGRNPEWTKAAAASDLVLIDGSFWS